MTASHSPTTADPTTAIYPGKDELCDDVADKLLDVIRATLRAEQSVHVALTGGGAGIGTLRSMRERLGRQTADDQRIDFSRVHFWWGDERLLPERDAERNAQQAADALLDELIGAHGLPEQNVHAMPSSEDAATPEAGALQYQAELALFGEDDELNGTGLQLPDFAVVLLGVGPDGHIASLFPGKASLGAEDVTVVGEEDSPKPPPPRVSLTLPAIQSARRVWTVVAGQDKAEATAAALSGDASVREIPAVAARGRQETVWHLDRAAASSLS